MSLLIIQVIIIIIHKDASEREKRLQGGGRNARQSLINSFFINVRLERRINIH